MTGRTLIVGIIALSCGIAAVVLVNGLQLYQENGSQVATNSIVVAAANVPRGNTLSEKDLRLNEWPADHVPEGAIRAIEECVGRSVTVDLARDEPLMKSKLSDKNAGRGMAANIPDGMRGYTIQTPTFASSVAGFVLPGNRVDVLLTINNVTTTLLQNIEIMAVGQVTNPPAENRLDVDSRMRSVTLVVTPDQAAKLTLAQTSGRLHLTLRNGEDDAAADTRPITLRELRYLQEDPLGGLLTTDPATRGQGEPTSPPKSEFDWKLAADWLKSMVPPPRVLSPADRASPTRTVVPPPRVRTFRGRQEGVVYFKAKDEDGRQRGASDN